MLITLPIYFLQIFFTFTPRNRSYHFTLVLITKTHLKFNSNEGQCKSDVSSTAPVVPICLYILSLYLKLIYENFTNYFRQVDENFPNSSID